MSASREDGVDRNRQRIERLVRSPRPARAREVVCEDTCADEFTDESDEDSWGQCDFHGASDSDEETVASESAAESDIDREDDSNGEGDDEHCLGLPDLTDSSSDGELSAGDDAFASDPESEADLPGASGLQLNAAGEDQDWSRSGLQPNAGGEGWVPVPGARASRPAAWQNCASRPAEWEEAPRRTGGRKK